MLFITVFVVPSCFRVCKKLLLQLILSLQPSEESSRADELINLQPDWSVKPSARLFGRQYLRLGAGCCICAI